MGKSLFIAEKPSVAKEFAKVLGISGASKDGYLESENSIVTWCVGHLVTMSYPDAYDPNLKRWSLDTIPFIPGEWKYQVIDSVKKQFKIVSSLLNRKDVETIYVCTDSGREGEYIYRLVRQMANVKDKKERRVWIDSQTEEEIKRGVAEAKDISEYDALADAAYLRAKEDYLMGINFSRALTLKFGNVIASSMKEQRAVVSVGRVMTCVLGMVVRREREIRNFVPTSFYRVLATLSMEGMEIPAEWKVTKDSAYFESPLLYKDNGFLKRETAEELIKKLSENPPVEVEVVSVSKKQEKKKPPLLFNLAEAQNECSKRFKISPDQTLQVIQDLYEKKMVTYPRTDARVLSTAVAKVIQNNISGLRNYGPLSSVATEVLNKKSFPGLAKTPYVDDKKITDHYAIIPTGQGIGNLKSVSPLHQKVYDLICRRFLCIFYPPMVFEKVSLEVKRMNEHFFANFKVLKDPGFSVVYSSLSKKEGTSEKTAQKEAEKPSDSEKESRDDDEEFECNDESFLERISQLKKGQLIPVKEFNVKEGTTSPPKRYTSGSLILAMENAGQLIEDEDLRAQIKGSGIGTSATRAEILKKLETIKYLKINKKTQVVTPELFGELVFDTVEYSMQQLLSPELTASWEKGLTYVAEGSVTSDEYMTKLSGFVTTRTENVKKYGVSSELLPKFRVTLKAYGK